MQTKQEDTICALATPMGEGGIGIIRVSGINSFKVVNEITILKNKKDLFVLKPYQASLADVFDENKEKIDEVIILKMQAPRSYTCEDVVEVQAHGGRIVLYKILNILQKKGVRLAEPGEFTRRAFTNGRIDLTQAEAVIDIIRAKTERSLRVANSQANGFLTQKIKALQKELLQIIAHIEVVIDYPDENIEERFQNDLLKELVKIKESLTVLLKKSKSGKILRDGLQVAIIGKPNAGKSSILNLLLQENRAIVTEIAGTTRDVIEESLSINGIPLVLSDTAGIRETENVIEQIGIQRSLEKIKTADVLFWVLDRSCIIDKEDHEILQQILLMQKKVILLLNKSDLECAWQFSFLEKEFSSLNNLLLAKIEFSATEALGIAELEEAVKGFVFQKELSLDDGIMANNLRQIGLLEKSLQFILDAEKAVSEGMPLECIVVDLRLAWESLGSIIGETVSEDIIKEIFANFCLGK